MTKQEIQEAILATAQDMAEREHAHCERYEDSSQFVGEILGAKVPAPKSAALAFIEATDDCCGVACDSDCACS